jgi:hypothetical protein
VAAGPELEKPAHKLHGLYAMVKNRVGDACDFCARAFDVKDQVVACGVKLAGDYEGHPNFRKPVSQAYQVITLLAVLLRGRHSAGEEAGHTTSPRLRQSPAIVLRTD